MTQYSAGPDNQDQDQEEDRHDYEEEVDDMLSEVVTQEEDAE